MDHSNARGNARRTAPVRVNHRRFRGAVLCAASVALVTTAPVAVPAATAQPSFPLPVPGTIGDLGPIQLPGMPSGGDRPDAKGGPDFTLSQSENLTDDSVVTIRGTGYAAGENIYVTQTIEKPTSGYPQTYGEAVKVAVDDAGTFTTELPVDVVFGDVDCRETQCYIASFTAFPKLQDRSQDVWHPISFVGGAANPAPAGGGASRPPGQPGQSGQSGQAGQTGQPGASRPSGTTGQAGQTGQTGQGAGTGATAPGGSGQSTGGPSVSLSTTEIAASGTTPITVTGTGFSTSGPGIYVGVAEKGRFSHTDASVFGAVNYIRTSEMGADGSFTTVLDVDPVFAGGNCIENACALYTFAAHGSSDRSQDTATDLTVGGTEAEKAAAATRAPNNGNPQRPGQNPSSRNPVGTKSNPGSGSGQPPGLGPSAEEADAQLASASSPMSTLATGLIGAVVGAALLGAGVFIGRRTRRD